MKYFKFCMYIVLLTTLPPMLKAEEELNRPVTAHDYLEGGKKTNLIEEHASLLHRLKFWNKNAKQEYDAANTAKMLSNETERSHYFNKFKLRREGKLNSIDEWWNESKIKLALEAQQLHNFKITMNRTDISDDVKKTLIRYLPDTMIKFITPDEISKIPNAFIGSFQPEQIPYFTPEQIQALKIDQIKQLQEEQLTAFTDEQLNEFSKDQIITFKNRVQEIANNKHDVQKKKLTDLISKIDTIRSAITKDQKTTYISIAQILSTKSNQISKIPNNTIKSLSIDQVLAFNRDQINALTSEQLSAFSDDQISSFKELANDIAHQAYSRHKINLNLLIQRIDQNKSQQPTAS